MQAVRAAEAIAAHGPIAAIYCSPLGRAQETAAPIARALALPVRIDHDLREIDHGAAEGLTWEELALTRPDWAERLMRDRGGVLDPLWPDGETAASIRERTERALGRIVPAHADDTIVVVGHGGALSWLVMSLVDPAHTLRPSYRLRNASLTEVVHREGAGQLLRVDDTSHLVDVTT